MGSRWDLQEKVQYHSLHDDVKRAVASAKKLEAALEEAKQRLEAITVEEVKTLILESQALLKEWYQAYEIAICLTSYDTADEQARQLLGEINILAGLEQNCQTALDMLLVQLSSKLVEEVLQDEEMISVAPIIQMRLQQQAKKGNLEAEHALKMVEGDGLHARGDLYTAIASKVVLHVDGQTIPAAKGVKTVYYGADRKERLIYFQKWKEGWEEQTDLCAKALNHIAGFRLQVQNKRNSNSIMEESFLQNRIEEKTVESMWDAFAVNREPLLDYLRRKKQLLHADSICWSDQFAPLPIVNKNETKLSFQEAIRFIQQQLQSFSPEMADFVEHAYQSNWIDAASKENKTIGAFCASFPKWKEPRIMMTFQHDLASTGVLAHELGHAYHYFHLYELPMFLQNIPPTIAEISSTLTETIVMDAALQKAESVEEKLQILNNQLIRDVGILLNGHVRYLFERSFYQKRQEKIVAVAELNELMVQAQKEAYGGILDTYEPAFWAALRHFYMTRMPFVHYPYTVAHLLSIGIYDFLKNKNNRSEQLKAIFQDASQLTIEELGEKYFAVNLQEPIFWKQTLERLYANVHLFLALSDDFV